MKNLYIYFFIIFIITFFSNNINSRSTRNVHGNYTLDDIQKNIDFKIKTERIIYENTEIIPVHFIIKNTGFYSFRFYVNQKFEETFYLEIIDETGKEIQNTIEIKNYPEKDVNINTIQKNKVEDLTGNPIKEIILHPNEEFIKTYYIYSLPKGKFKILGYFIPYSYDNQYKKNLKLISLNSISLEITEEKNIFYFDGSLKLPKENIPSPEETVFLFLTAEYYKNWDHYFKYVELKEFIKSYDIFYNEYNNADIRRKEIILKDFKNFLMNQNIEPILHFKILKVSYYNPDNSIVEVEILRGSKNYKVRYLYKYTLVKKDMWKIHNVLVSILKTGN